VKIPYKDVFDQDGKAKVQLGILGSYYVEEVRDTAGNRFLSVGKDFMGMSLTYGDETRSKVLETLLLSLIAPKETR
jgi:hypothetical protein